MKQLAHVLMSGTMSIIDAPLPVVRPGYVLVRTHYSLISTGTEGATVRTAKKSLIEKALERPQQVKQVLEVALTQGPVQAYRAAMKKLDAYSPLGYSSVGTVEYVGQGVEGLKKGDRVACGGNTANHAEYNTVPVHLCARVPDAVLSEDAAFTTVGAICLHAIRQAGVEIGSRCGVIGMGLLGQITARILEASGVRVFGMDISDEILARTGLMHTFNTKKSGSSEALLSVTDHEGLDAVLITASCDDATILDYAGSLVRKCGKVVIVGDIPLSFSRDIYYKKEIPLVISCSYGPGRYDLRYEELGIDYPIGYVRWTEQRNMAAFLDLLNRKSIDVHSLITHRWPLLDAPQAYDMIVKGRVPSVGMLITYENSVRIPERRIDIIPSHEIGDITIGMIGSGSYAQGYILPCLRKRRDIVRKGILSASGLNAVSVAKRFRFSFATSSEEEIYTHKDINTVFIETRHDSHALYVKRAIETEKNVFVEKPLCTTEDELHDIRAAYDRKSEVKTVVCMVGFNRRYAPLSVQLKKELGAAPKTMIYRVNAGHIPYDHWIHDPEIGGGRIIGEVCHFVDFMLYLAGERPSSVYAVSSGKADVPQDTVSVVLTFPSGSTGTIVYVSSGNKKLPKEYIEVHAGGSSFALSDFKTLTQYQGSRQHVRKSMIQNKGQGEMLDTFLKVVRQGGAGTDLFYDGYWATLVTFKVLESLRTNSVVSLECFHR